MDERFADPQEWQQVIEQHEQNREDDHDESFAVWPENWKTVRIFLSLSRSYQQDGFSGQFIGVHRADIESALIMFNIRPTKRRALMESLLAMQSAALEVLNRR